MRVIDSAIEAAAYKAKYMKIADSLYGLQATKNGGQGIQCVKDMCGWLRQGEVNKAREIYNWDADKFADKYPDVDEYICLKLNCKPRYGINKWKSEARSLHDSIYTLLDTMKVGEENAILGVPVSRLSKDRYWAVGILEGNSIKISEVTTLIWQRNQV